MIDEQNNISITDSILESLTSTLLYEGYSLFPYHRNAIKNQKPIPFGVVYPSAYNQFNVHAHCEMITDCVLNSTKDSTLNINVRFLHLIKTEVFENKKEGNIADNFVPVYDLYQGNSLYQSGWQTIERTIPIHNFLPATNEAKEKSISFSFEEEIKEENIYDDQKVILGKKIASILPVNGNILVKLIPVENIADAFRVLVIINNTTPIENAGDISRDEIFRQSFLSTNTILKVENGEFISSQDPPAVWTDAVAASSNKDTWPILIDKGNTTFLSSPIIVYDYPEINPKSKGDLFDSLEIEEALMLHFSVMSDEEKEKIATSDEKLRAMLDKVSQVTPDEIISLHGGFSNVSHPLIHDNKQK